jgi:putative ABC transport system permease protein
MLKDASRGTSGERLRMRRALIVAEVALALVLLIGAGLMLRSFPNLTQVDPGFRVAQVLTVEIAVPSTRYKEARERAAIYQRILERLETLPGVISVGAINILPLRGVGSSRVFIEGQPMPEPGNEQLASQRVVTPDYFRALGIPLLTGRTFTAREAWQASDAMIINQAMARRFWPGQDPVGKRMKHDPRGEWQTVIGVVGDVRQRSLSMEAQPEYYMSPASSTGNVRMTYAIRTQSDPVSLVGAIRAQVSAVEPNVALANVMTMERVVEAATAQPRLWSALIGLFAVVALALASIGIYGVVAYTVSQRRQEIGIRMALGANAGDVIRLIVGGGMKPVLLGVAIGLVAALALTRLMNTLLFGVTATDPMTFAGVSLLLTMVALVASLVPARRAIKSDPVAALRGE